MVLHRHLTAVDCKRRSITTSKQNAFRFLTNKQMHFLLFLFCCRKGSYDVLISFGAIFLLPFPQSRDSSRVALSTIQGVSFLPFLRRTLPCIIFYLSLCWLDLSRSRRKFDIYCITAFALGTKIVIGTDSVFLSRLALRLENLL